MSPEEEGILKQLDGAAKYCERAKFVAEHLPRLIKKYGILTDDADNALGDLRAEYEKAVAERGEILVKAHFYGAIIDYDNPVHVRRLKEVMEAELNSPYFNKQLGLKQLRLNF